MKIFVLLCMALCALFTVQSVTPEGFYGTLSLGVSSTNGEAFSGNLEEKIRKGLKTKYALTPAVIPVGVTLETIKTKRSEGLSAGASLGYRMLFEKFFLDTEFNASYDRSSPLVFGALLTVPSSVSGRPASETFGIGQLRYRPDLGVGVSIKAGQYIGQSIGIYFKCGVMYDLSKILAYHPLSQKMVDVNFKTSSLIPGIGIEGQITKKLLWTAALDYKIPFHMQAPTSGFGSHLHFTKKPSSFTVKAGLIWFPEF